MRYALVDDATLEAAKRIEGKTVTKNANEAAGDILAMENLIQAILFCDQILYLSPTGSRRNSDSKFFEPFQQVRLEDGAYSRLMQQANRMTDAYIPCIEGGEFTDDFFVHSLKALGLDIRFLWEKKTDHYCLTPRILQKGKDLSDQQSTKLLNIMQTELSDRSFLPEISPRIPLLYDSEGQIINNCYEVKDRHGKKYPAKLSEQTDALFKALNLWLCARTFILLLPGN